MKIALLASVFCLLCGVSSAQYGVLPFSGITYHEQGIVAKEITAELDGKTWTGGMLPQKAGLEVILEEPGGLAAGQDGNYHPDADMIILKSNGDTMGRGRHIFTANSREGLPAYNLKHLKMTLGFDERAVIGETYMILLSFYDAVPGNNARIDLRIVAKIAAPDYLPAPVTVTLYSASGTDGYNAMANGDFNLKKVEAGVDTVQGGIRASLRFPGLQNISVGEIEKGKISYYLYDRKALPIYSIAPSAADSALMPHDVAVSVGGSPKAINLLVVFPLSAVANATQAGFIRYRWESADGVKILDCVSSVSR